MSRFLFIPARGTPEDAVIPLDDLATELSRTIGRTDMENAEYLKALRAETAAREAKADELLTHLQGMTFDEAQKVVLEMRNRLQLRAVIPAAIA